MHSRATCAVVASRPSRSVAIVHSDSPGSTVCDRSPGRAGCRAFDCGRPARLPRGAPLTTTVDRRASSQSKVAPPSTGRLASAASPGALASRAACAAGRRASARTPACPREPERTAHSVNWSRVLRGRFGRVVGRRRRRCVGAGDAASFVTGSCAIARIDDRLTLVDGRLLLDRRGVVVIGVDRRLNRRQERRLREIRRVAARIEIGIRRRTAVRRDRRPALLLLVGLPGSERRRDWRAG